MNMYKRNFQVNHSGLLCFIRFKNHPPFFRPPLSLSLVPSCPTILERGKTRTGTLRHACKLKMKRLTRLKFIYLVWKMSSSSRVSAATPNLKDNTKEGFFFLRKLQHPRVALNLGLLLRFSYGVGIMM